MRYTREWWRDEATHAFVRFASLGCPTVEQYEDRIRKDCYNRLSLQNPQFIVNKANAEISARKPLLNDIEAVNRVIDMLNEQGKQYIVDAMKAVYFFAPTGTPTVGSIKYRVRRFAMEYPASERTVYRWLKAARLLYAMERGIDVGKYENERL